jgi:ribosomal protein L23
VVPKELNKHDIRNYLELIYDLTVLKVHTVIMPGRTWRNKRTGIKYRTGEVKKAFVYLDEEFTVIFSSLPIPCLYLIL